MRLNATCRTQLQNFMLKKMSLEQMSSDGPHFKSTLFLVIFIIF